MIERRAISGIAIDCGGTKTAVAKIENGEVVRRLQQFTKGDATPVHMVDSFFELVNQLDPHPEDRICAALSGRIDVEGTWYSVNHATLAGIGKVPIADMLKSRFKRTVPVLNDAVAGAVAEQKFGSGAGCARLAYITISTGVGAGIVIDGKPLLSSGGLAGHVGFTSSPQSNRTCGSGRYGTVESVASGKAIADISAESGHTDDPVKVFSAFRNGEPWAVKIVSQSATAIAELTADLAAILDIERFVIGGSVGLAAGYIEQITHAQLGIPELFRVPVVKATLDDAVLLGALAQSIESGGD